MTRGGFIEIKSGSQILQFKPLSQKLLFLGQINLFCIVQIAFDTPAEVSQLVLCDFRMQLPQAINVIFRKAFDQGVHKLAMLLRCK